MVYSGACIKHGATVPFPIPRDWHLNRLRPVFWLAVILLYRLPMHKHSGMW